jgi:hypothetical protein
VTDAAGLRPLKFGLLQEGVEKGCSISENRDEQINLH